MQNRLAEPGIVINSDATNVSMGRSALILTNESNLGMIRLGCQKISTRVFLAITCSLLVTARAAAQTSTQPITIPLDIITEAAGGQSFDRLGINVGVNGATPEEYIFDTGSTAFNIDVGSGASGQPWFPIIPGVPITPTIPAMNLYGNGTYGNLGANSTIGSIQFYNSGNGSQAASFANNQGIPVLINTGNVATTASLAGDQAGAQVGYFLPAIGYGLTFNEINNNVFGLPASDFVGEIPMYYDATWQANLNAGIGPEDGGGYNLFGIFGAGPFQSNSVLGNLTTTGYVVSANSELNGPHSCTACGNVILNLNAAVRAQFISLVPWNAASTSTFPLTNAPVDANQFDLNFSYTLGGSPYSVVLTTLLDSGTPSIYLNDQGLLTTQTAAGNVNQYGDEVPGVKLTMTGTGAGDQPTSILTGNDSSGDYSNVTTPGPDGFTNPGQALYGISFFFNNSVMYDLQNQETGYTPFYVTDTPISTNNGGYTISSSMAAQGIAGVISGTGPLTITTGGAAQLTGTNLYTGATNIAQGGWLGLAGPGSIATSSGVNDNGTFDISRVSAMAQVQSLTGTGTVALGANTLELTNASGNFAGSLTDGGLIGGTGGSLIIAGGAETLSGTNSFTGSTGISPGAQLALTGSLAGSVIDAGLLTGTGSIGNGLVVANTGAVMPGTAPSQFATLTVNGNFLQSAGSTYIAYFNPAKPGQSSQINVSGVADLGQGAILDAIPVGQVQPYTLSRFSVLDAQGGIQGSYTLLNSALTASLGLELVDPPQNLYLQIVQRRSLASFAATRNQAATLAGLNSTPSTNASYIAVTNLMTGAQIQAAANQLSGDIHPSILSATLNDAGIVRNAVDQRAFSMLDPTGPDAATGQMTQAGQHAIVFWGDGLGAGTHFQSNGNAGTLTDALGGFVVGADAALSPQIRAGLFAGYSNASVSLPSRAASGSSDDAYVGLYGGRRLGPVLLSLGATYGQNYLSTTRSVSLPGINEAETSRYDASTAQIYGQVGYPLTTIIKAHRVNLLPFAQLAYINLSSAAFQESGGSAALHGYGSTLSMGISTIGARAETNFTLKGRTIAAFAKLGWQHAYGTVNPTEALSFPSGQPFTVQGVSTGRDAAITQLGLAVRLTPKISANIAYNGSFARHVTSNGVNAGLDWHF